MDEHTDAIMDGLLKVIFLPLITILALIFWVLLALLSTIVFAIKMIFALGKKNRLKRMIIMDDYMACLEDPFIEFMEYLGLE